MESTDCRNHEKIQNWLEIFFSAINNLFFDVLIIFIKIEKFIGQNLNILENFNGWNLKNFLKFSGQNLNILFNLTVEIWIKF